MGLGCANSIEVIFYNYFERLAFWIPPFSVFFVATYFMKQLFLWNLCVNPHLLAKSNMVDFSFCKKKESKFVDHVETIIYAIFFIFCCLQPTSSFYYLLEPSVVNHHYIIKFFFCNV
jgi:hypothetical protein